MKLLLAILLVASVAYADNVKISELTLATAASTATNDSFPFVSASANATKRVTLWDLINLPPMVSTYAPKASPTFTGTVTAPTFLGNLTGSITGTSSNVSGTVQPNHGGTGFTTYVLGDTIYSSATNSLAKLAGNITTVPLVLTQTGTGAVSAAPAWSTVARATLGADAKNWVFLGSATGNTVTIGPVVWSGTYRQFQVFYFIAGYSAGTNVPRLLMGSAAISTTALTNGTRLAENFGGATNLASLPGAPLTEGATVDPAQGYVFVDGASGQFKRYEVTGQRGAASIATPPQTTDGAGNFSDLGTNLALQRMQLTVYTTTAATTPSANTFAAGTYFAVYGRNTD